MLFFSYYSYVTCIWIFCFIFWFSFWSRSFFPRTKFSKFASASVFVVFYDTDKIVPTTASSNSRTSHGLVVGADIVHSVVFHKIVPITASSNSRTLYTCMGLVIGGGCWYHSLSHTLPLVCQQGFFCEQVFSKILILADGI